MDMGSYVAMRTDEHILEVIQAIQAERRAVPIASREIAERAGCHINTVTNALKRLEKTGKLRISPEKGQPNRIEILAKSNAPTP